jgi:hypothetical protein
MERPRLVFYLPGILHFFYLPASSTGLFLPPRIPRGFF